MQSEIEFLFSNVVVFEESKQKMMMKQHTDERWWHNKDRTRIHTLAFDDTSRATDKQHWQNTFSDEIFDSNDGKNFI